MFLFVFSTIKLRNISTVASGFGGMTVVNGNDEFVGKKSDKLLVLMSKKQNN